MRRILNSPPHVYAHERFDRAAIRRTDEAWLQSRRRDPNSRVIHVSRDLKFGFRQECGETRAIIRRLDEHEEQLPDDAIFLGLSGEEIAVFAVGHSDEHLGDQHAGGAELDHHDLRQFGPSLPADEAGLLAYARALVHWHNTHLYCGSCGERTAVIQGGHARRCPACSRQVFPRTDPAVIVLVILDNCCLMARSPRFLPNMYSTLAGFVEPGESLEMTLRREVFEEVGVKITDLSYRSSQPWPFPQSLMLGFRARALDDTLKIDQDEIEDAMWVEKSLMMDDQRRPFSLPRADSIARFLIEEWLAESP